MLTDSEIAAIDLDHCRDAETGAIDDWAADLISRVPGAYIEVTASGGGLRIIGRGAGAKLHRRFKIEGAQDGAAIELYRKATRYITVSGLEVGTCDELPNIDDLLDSLSRSTPDLTPVVSGAFATSSRTDRRSANAATTSIAWSGHLPAWGTASSRSKSG